MKYRYTKKENDLFFVCSLIEYISRNSNLSKKEIIETLGITGIKRLFYLADVYHSENIDKVLFELSNKYEFEICKNTISDDAPTYYDMGKVYSRLISEKAKIHHESYIVSFIKVYKSNFTKYLDSYKGNMMLSNTQYLFQSYLAKKPLEY